MSQQYAYVYAEIDPIDNMCIGVFSRTLEISEEDQIANNFVEIPVNDPEYICKYYINGNWYEDAAGTIPWTSSLL